MLVEVMVVDLPVVTNGIVCAAHRTIERHVGFTSDPAFTEAADATFRRAVSRRGGIARLLFFDKPPASRSSRRSKWRGHHRGGAGGNSCISPDSGNRSNASTPRLIRVGALPNCARMM